MSKIHSIIQQTVGEKYLDDLLLLVRFMKCVFSGHLLSHEATGEDLWMVVMSLLSFQCVKYYFL